MKKIVKIKKTQNAFTFVELLIVFLMIAIIAGVFLIKPEISSSAKPPLNIVVSDKDAFQRYLEINYKGIVFDTPKFVQRKDGKTVGIVISKDGMTIVEAVRDPDFKKLK